MWISSFYLINNHLKFLFKECSFVVTCSIFLKLFEQDLTNQARLLQSQLSEMHRRLRWIICISFFFFGFCCMPFYRIHPWSVVLLLIVYFIEFCRYWTNPDKINSMEHLGQMENSLRDSLNHLRMHKVSLSFLWLGPSKEVLYLPFSLMKTIGDWN